MAGLFGSMANLAKNAFGSTPGGLSGSDKLMLLGATLSDLGNDDASNLLATQKVIGERRDKAAADEWIKRAPTGLFGGQRAARGGIMPAGTGMAQDPVIAGVRGIPGVQGINPAGGSGNDTLDPFSSGLGAAVGLATTQADAPVAQVPSLADALPWVMEGIQRGDPRAAQYLSVLKAAQPDAPVHIEGNDGIYERQPDSTWKRVVEYPAQQRVSPGWEPDPEDPGAWRPVKNGPYDPAYIRRTAGERRDAVTSRPMPRVGGGGGRGGASIPPPPAGWSRR